MRICAIVVTCNRKEMVSRLLEDFEGQTHKPNGIIVVDNGSEDGTGEYIRSNFPEVKLYCLQDNIGHMGALAVAIEKALQQGYDAVVSVDDDARLRDDTMESLFQSINTHKFLKDAIVWCANVSPDGKFFTEPVCIKIGEEWKIYHEFHPDLYGKIYETTGGANIGLYIPRKAIEAIGLPRTELVFNGEEDLKFRFSQAGFKRYYCFSSIIYHKRYFFHEFKFRGKTRFVSRVSPWHTYYEIRNRIYIDRLYKRRTTFKTLLVTAVDSAIKLYISKKRLSVLFYILRAVYDGLRGNMGMRVKIPR
jgi:rhamnopyranosyl-N-acetylglucosaminyl-diphospho-decaprenol beta-1,3/1,4-galactofuranosyltransferase